MYEAVIGIEIHCELKTDTKMFSGAPLTYGKAPNTAINEIDLALPGTMPAVNKKAVEYGVRLAKALHCEIDPVLRFDRKNYFYSDLPKGYQITQQYYPLGKNGLFKVLLENEETKEVRINRIHLEEDTAKQFHDGGRTRIDFNRAGTPLVEVVTEADFRNGHEAAAYVDAFRLLVVHQGVSDAVMAEGSLRCDINISLRPKGQEAFGTKVEIKNLNSISNIQKAIDFEIDRQTAMLEKGEAIVQETRRFDESSETTVRMRVKDEAVDYRYFRDANIPNIRIPDAILEAEIVERPFDRMMRYQKDYGLSLYDAKVLVQNKELADYFDGIVSKSKAYKQIVNWLTQDVLAVYDQKGDRSLDEWIAPGHFLELIEALEEGTISSKQAKKVFEALCEGKSPKAYIEEQGMVQINDEALIRSWIEEILEGNPQVVEDYRNGLKKSMGFVVGQIMKRSKGQANPRLSSQLVKEILDSKV